MCKDVVIVKNPYKNWAATCQKNKTMYCRDLQQISVPISINRGKAVYCYMLTQTKDSDYVNPQKLMGLGNLIGDFYNKVWQQTKMWKGNWRTAFINYEVSSTLEFDGTFSTTGHVTQKCTIFKSLYMFLSLYSAFTFHVYQRGINIKLIHPLFSN